MLMRRDDLIVLGGYARLRDTLIEDIRMAELFKRNGRRTYRVALITPSTRAEKRRS